MQYGDEVTEAHVAGDVTILMDDGGTVVAKNNGGMAMQWEDNGSLTCRQSLFLPQVVDVARVSSITVGGTEFPVKESKGRSKTLIKSNGAACQRAGGGTVLLTQSTLDSRCVKRTVPLTQTGDTAQRYCHHLLRNALSAIAKERTQHG